MGRTRSERGNKLPVWNNLPENFPERRKAGSRGVLSSAAVGRVGKPENSLPGSRLKTNQRLLEGQGVLNRGKAHEKGAFFKTHLTNIDEESEESDEEEVLHEGVDQEGVPAVGGGNLMGPLLSPGQSLVLTQLMRENKRWTCTSCCKSIFSENNVRREKLKPATCKVVVERVFSDEDIKKRLTNVEIH